MGRRERYDAFVTPLEVDTKRSTSRAPHVDPGMGRSWLGRAPTFDADRVVATARASIEARLFGLGTVIRCGRYVLGPLLGEGGMGAVYRARDEELDRDVAVKIVQLPLDAGDERPVFEEARAAAAVVHPNVVEVYDVGVSDLGIYIAMELVEGVDLRRWMTQRPRSVAEVLQVFRGAGAGLAAAHAAGLVHHDFKPENVLMDDDRPRVADFGLARAFGPSVGASGHGWSPGGTPAYVAPELILGEAVGQAADQFSFCVSLYEALYGVRPFSGRSTAQLFRNVIAGRHDPIPPGRPVPEHVRRALMRGLATDPARRHADMNALLHALHDAPRRRWLPWVLGVSVASLCVIAVAGGPVAAPDPCDGDGNALAGVWDPARRADLGRVLVDKEAVARSTAARLDEYASEWHGAHQRTCVALRRGDLEPPEADQRFACLHQRRADLRALIDVLVQDEGDAIAHAAKAASSLSPPTGCETDAAGPLARPEALASCRALVNTGQSAQAAIACGRVAEDARRRGDAFVLAEALLAQGTAHDEAGSFDEAVLRLEDAYFVAEGAELPRVAVIAASRLVFLHGFRRESFVDAASWYGSGKAALERLGGDEHREAALTTAFAAALDADGQTEKAIAMHRRAVALHERAGRDDPDLGAALTGLGNAYVSAGDFGAAEEALRRASAIFERDLPADDPTIAEAMINRANALVRLSRAEEARALLQEAVERLSATRGPDHPHVGTALNTLGGVALFDGDVQGAIDAWTRAQTIFTDALGPDAATLATVASNLGVAYEALERYDDALANHHRAVVIVEGAMGPDHAGIATPLFNVGHCLVVRGTPDEAIEPLQRALRLHDAGRLSPILGARIVLELARAYRGSDPERAAELARRARTEVAAAGTLGQRYAPKVDALLADLDRR